MKKMTMTTAFKLLGEIDKKVEKKKITEEQHNTKTKIVLKRLIKSQRR